MGEDKPRDEVDPWSFRRELDHVEQTGCCQRSEEDVLVCRGLLRAVVLHEHILRVGDIRNSSGSTVPHGDGVRQYRRNTQPDGLYRRS